MTPRGAPRLVPERRNRIALGLDAKELDVRHRLAPFGRAVGTRSFFQIAARRLSSSIANRHASKAAAPGAAPPRAPRRRSRRRRDLADAMDDSTPHVAEAPASFGRNRFELPHRHRFVRFVPQRLDRAAVLGATAHDSVKHRDAAVAGTGDPVEHAGTNRLGRQRKHDVIRRRRAARARARRHRAVLHRIPPSRRCAPRASTRARRRARDALPPAAPRHRRSRRLQAQLERLLVRAEQLSQPGEGYHANSHRTVLRRVRRGFVPNLETSA